MNKELHEWMGRMDPDILEALKDTDGFETVVGQIKSEADEVHEKLAFGPQGFDLEAAAYLFAIQTQAINRMVDEIAELRPAIRFITSVLLGNTDTESDEDA